MTDYQAFLGAYIEAIFFTETGDIDQPPTDSELSAFSKLQAGQDCGRFWGTYGALIVEAGADPSQAGHDFWLTRQGHGTGFWDRDDDTYGTEELRDELDRASRCVGEVGEIIFAHEERE